MSLPRSKRDPEIPEHPIIGFDQAAELLADSFTFPDRGKLAAFLREVILLILTSKNLPAASPQTAEQVAFQKKAANGNGCMVDFWVLSKNDGRRLARIAFASALFRGQQEEVVVRANELTLVAKCILMMIGAQIGKGGWFPAASVAKHLGVPPSRFRITEIIRGAKLKSV